MGTFRQNIAFVSADGQRREELDAQVDTGATFSSAPADVLERLGVRPETRVRLRLANNAVEERLLGFARAELVEEERIIPVVFGRTGEPPLIGATTLEIFLLAVDLVEQRLVPVEGLLL
ncbi:MAG: aspartyl protease [Chloroflexi bacterium]|nr:aspartyl protease [Chloroflexota bacterium]